MTSSGLVRRAALAASLVFAALAILWVVGVMAVGIWLSGILPGFWVLALFVAFPAIVPGWFAWQAYDDATDAAPED